MSSRLNPPVRATILGVETITARSASGWVWQLRHGILTCTDTRSVVPVPISEPAVDRSGMWTAARAHLEGAP